MELADISERSDKITLMKKIFGDGELIETQPIPAERVSALISSVYPHIIVDNDELNKIIQQTDKNASGLLDFDSITKIIFSLLMKQSFKDADWLDIEDVHSTQLKLNDFIIFDTI